jgi:hypothetical protein
MARGHVVFQCGTTLHDAGSSSPISMVPRAICVTFHLALPGPRPTNPPSTRPPPTRALRDLNTCFLVTPTQEWNPILLRRRHFWIFACFSWRSSPALGRWRRQRHRPAHYPYCVHQLSNASPPTCTTGTLAARSTSLLPRFSVGVPKPGHLWRTPVHPPSSPPTGTRPLHSLTGPHLRTANAFHGV